MTTVSDTPAEADVFISLRQRLATNSDGILEDIARTYSVSVLDVMHALPEENCKIVSGEHFEAVLNAISAWGAILFIVHTADLVLECEGPLPLGSFGRGYFNLHGDSPIGGHIRASRCKEIAFVSRPFMGRASRSVQFFNIDGGAMFKVFVRRDKDRNLIAEQVQRFDALRDSF